MFESISDRLIREAIERGEFDDLPGAGKPIPGSGRPYDPNWWIKSLLERERADDDRRAAYQRLETRIGALMWATSETGVRDAVARINREIEKLDAAGEGRFEHFEVDDVVKAWKSTHRVLPTPSRRRGLGSSEHL